MDKKILGQYIDACALVEETRAELNEVREKKTHTEHIVVKGSDHEFPYTVKNFHSEGIASSSFKTSRYEEELEKILRQRIDNAMRIKLEVEAWMLTIPLRMQRIIRYKFFDNNTWGKAATRIGRGATGESIKKEFQRFMREK